MSEEAMERAVQQALAREGIAEEVVAAGQVRTRFQAAALRGLSRFVGREAEMEQLRGALEAAGVDHEFHIYPGLGHGFLEDAALGLGEGRHGSQRARDEQCGHECRGDPRVDLHGRTSM